jgi:MYXO-CTERM domain-containing protein
MRCAAALLALGVWAAAVTPAQAGLVLVTSRAGLGGNDTIDWGQLGATGATVPSPSNALSVGGLTFQVSQPGGNFERRDQGNGWNGNFAPGDHILWTENFNTGGGGPMTLRGPGVSAIGTQIMADFFGAFVARISAFDSGGNSLGSFTEAGNSSSAANNSAIFIGVRSDSTPIARILLSLDSAVSSPNDFAINTVSLDSRQVAATPEPPTIIGGALGALIGLGYAWRRRRRESARTA